MASAVVHLALGPKFEIVADFGAFEQRIVAAGVGTVLSRARLASR